MLRSHLFEEGTKLLFTVA